MNDLQSIVGKKITGFSSDFKKAIKTVAFDKKIIGKKISKIFRSGKNIIITLSSDDFIVVHLKMTGQLLLTDNKQLTTNNEDKNSLKYNKHIHHIFYLDKKFTINFSDIRKFGTLELINKDALDKKIAEKGLDPFSSEYTFENFEKLLERGQNKNLKTFLMDQSYIAGIGNIYASEIPFDMKISPLRNIGDLNNKEKRNLFLSINKILTKALQLRGTSFSDYRDSSGKKGSFQNFLKVYKRNGQKCKVCDTMIEKMVIGQRSTFYCPNCQI